ncbi:glycine--tRNA ligase subunit beta [Polaromonas sp.]|uniref:glycine--tRNA ligase subunit beta n=1 Tax=Polaromonas sp. TaxID=1869339 RepID=UPI002FC852CC
MTTKNLLVELFVEELPPKALKKLGDAFAGVLLEQLKGQGLATAEAVLTSFASPRRLAAHITAVAAQAADKAVSQKLMPVTVGLDASGTATPALLKKLQALGADASAVASLKRAPDGKAEALFYDSTVKGATLVEGLQKALLEAIRLLPIPKVMTYQLESNCELPGWSSVSFVRPAHGLVALHGSEVVPVEALGLKAGNVTHGHRFEASVDPVVLKDADSYAQALQQDGAVIASFAERKAEIARQLAAAAAKVGGGAKAIEDDALLDEVTALVERPHVLVCEFEKEFLEVPQECLILTMKANQKYFPLLDSSGKLTNKFLVVSNISPEDASAVIGGNERVVRPRLADAKFFFDQDRKKTLESRVSGLGKVTYHNKLGSQNERMLRVKAITEWVAERIGADVDLAGRAAFLAKADLLTDMVGEFPELQGVMGGYYARHDGENALVAEAIEDQYLLQRDHTDAASLVSVALDIADRAETLVGIWGIGLKPTGEKDPYALRRHALTLINRFELLSLAAFLGDGNFKLHLLELLEYALRQFPAGLLGQQTLVELTEFIYDRFHNRLVGLGGHRVEIVDAVVSQRPPLHEIVRRIQAVADFAALSEAPALAAANKRVGNILKKVEGTVEAKINPALLQEPAEKSLAEALQSVAPKADAAFAAGDYAVSLQALAALKAPVDEFFDKVMVNADDLKLRANRLGLLATLHQAMNRVADLSKLAA